MNERFFRKGITCAFVMFFFVVGMYAQQQRFSLDDLPHAPYAGPQVIGYGSAEDEFGLGLPASLAGLIGPSPSLLLGFQDSDILIPGTPQPILFFRFPLPPYYMDAFCYNHKDYEPDDYPNIKLRFSIDRGTGGNTTASASYTQALLNQQPADIFQGKRLFPHPGTFPPPPTTTAASNTLIYDDSFFPLVTGWTYTNSSALAPPITIGSHDNIDGFNELPPGVITGNIYFSVHPAELFLSGLQSGDIYVISSGVIWMFAPASSMGLNAEADSIDALVVWDLDDDGYYDPGYDYAIYSLAPGSLKLQNVTSLDGGTVFWTNFNGTSTVYAYATNLGIGILPQPPLPPLGEPNVDALEIKTLMQPGEPGEPGGVEPPQ